MFGILDYLEPVPEPGGGLNTGKDWRQNMDLCLESILLKPIPEPGSDLNTANVLALFCQFLNLLKGLGIFDYSGKP